MWHQKKASFEWIESFLATSDSSFPLKPIDLSGDGTTILCYEPRNRSGHVLLDRKRGIVPMPLIAETHAGSLPTALSRDGRCVVGTSMPPPSLRTVIQDGQLVGVENTNPRTEAVLNVGGMLFEISQARPAERTTGHSLAFGVNKDGSVVVGECRVNENGRQMPQAYRWTRNEGFVPIGYLPLYGENSANNMSEASAVSADGNTVIGKSRTGKITEAFVWTKATGMQPLRPFNPKNTDDTKALAVSDDGSVVLGDGLASGFLWRRGAGMTPLAPLAGTDNNSVRGSDLSGDGRLVVGGTLNTALLWIDNRPVRLASVVERLGFGKEIEGCELKGSFLGGDTLMISGDGTTILGYTQKAGTRKVFLLTDPARFQGK
jgi:uncharacterized membrane protein